MTSSTANTAPTGTPLTQGKSVSLLQRRIKKFKSLKRGYYSFLFVLGLYVFSFILAFFINNKALIVHYNGEYYFPVFKEYIAAKTLGMTEDGEAPANFRKLQAKFEQENGDNWLVMPPYPWDPDERDQETKLVNEDGTTVNYPYPPSSTHWLGTDPSGRDVFARMAYGFRVSISFALLLTIINYSLGATLGGLMGYYGKKIDLFGQRLLEVWSNIPFFFLVLIVSSIIQPSFIILIFLLSLFGWIGMSYLMRGEFLREKAKDYVSAAISLGATDRQIIFKHILPNSLTPIIATLPFAIIGGISTLVGLDYLGFGLQGKLPSWGEMLQIGNDNKEHLWLLLSPIGAMFITLLLMTFIGEALREAFDPKEYSRLR